MDGQDPYVQSIKSFQIREGSEQSDWEAIKVQSRNLSTWGVRTLRRGLDGVVRSVIKESKYICKDHRNMFSNYYSKRFVVGSSYCERLHFFTKAEIKPEDLWLTPEEYFESYLGYSVIRPVKERCLGRTVVDPYKIKQNISDDFFCLRTVFEPRFIGSLFKVNGYPYTSQNGEAMVCAHASLWGVCRYLSQRYSNYAEIYPYDLILLTPDYLGRRVPYRSMTYADYSTILTKFGVYPLVMQVNNDDRYRDLYSYVESGFPVLASIGGHVITLIGHTIDYNKTAVFDSNNMTDSCQFLKQYVVVDDNCFPYALFSNHNDSANYHSTKQISDIVTAVCPLPEKAFLPADKARKKTEKCILTALNEIKQIGGNTKYVKRMFLTTGKAFQKRKRAEAIVLLKDHPPESARLLYALGKLSLPHFIWVMEVSTLDQYKKGRCLSEVVIDATVGRMPDGMIYMRIGKNLLANTKGKTYNILFVNTDDTYNQYTHNLGERCLE